MILFGFKGCGKTHFGRLLAQRLQRTFIDVDALIEQKFGEELSCRQIALKIGEEAFRKIEQRVLFDLQPQEAIIALGGGAILDPENQQKLSLLGQLVYLKAAKETVKNRMREPVPSFLDAQNFEASFEEMYQQRLSIYEGIAAVHIPTENKTEAEILNALLRIAHGQ